MYPSRPIRGAFLAALVSLTATTVNAHGFLDQVNDPTPFSGISNVCFPEPDILIYQSFTPTRVVLSGIDLKVLASLAQVGKTIDIRLFEDGPDGAVIAEAGTRVPLPDRGPVPTAWAHFDFVPPLIVTPGRTYVIGWQRPASTFWIGSLGDTYKDGRAFNCNGQPWIPNIDMAFRTHAEPASERAPDRRGQRFGAVEGAGSSSAVPRPTWGELKLRYR